MSKRCLIVAGAEIGSYDLIRSRLREDDFTVYCDSGLKHMEKLGKKPDLIVGDFDSHENPHLDAETIVLPCEKDDTDTAFAVKTAIGRGYDDFLLVGVIGGRLDHTLGNISLLFMLDGLGKKALALDDYSELSVISRETARIDDSCAYFSLLNISGKADKITIKNAKYPLENASISCEWQYGISNEVLPGKTAEVTVGDGRLLLIKVLEK